MSKPKSLFIGNLVTLADLFCQSTGQTRASVAKALYGRGGQIDDLASGRRDLVTKSAEDALRWFSDNWPADLDWPPGIARPEPLRPAALDDPDLDLPAGAPRAIAAPEAVLLVGATSGAAVSGQPHQEAAE